MEAMPTCLGLVSPLCFGRHSVSACASRGLHLWRSWCPFSLKAGVSCQHVEDRAAQTRWGDSGSQRSCGLAARDHMATGEPAYSARPHVYWFAVIFAVSVRPKLHKLLHHGLHRIFASFLNLTIYSIIFCTNQSMFMTLGYSRCLFISFEGAVYLLLSG